MARQGGFLSGPSRHNTQKIRKHRLKIGVTRDMNAAAGALVNTKNPNRNATMKPAQQRGNYKKKKKGEERKKKIKRKSGEEKNKKK